MNDRNERLRAILSQGDPAAGDPGLPPEELQAMRRAVLSAVPEPRRRGWLVPVLPAIVAAAALALATALALSPWRPESRPEPPVIAHPVQPTPSPRPPAVQVPLVPEAPVRMVEKAGRTEKPRKCRTTRPVPEPVRTVVAQHQIQFSTPGGTRVIWVPNPAAE